MRTTECTLDITLAGMRPAAARQTGFAGALKTVWRLMRNRSAIGSLQDLDDHQLLDIGLRREDVRDALTSPFLENPGSHLTQAARNRANNYYRSARSG
ncbi:DUF1127 domain-containing protein [Rhizobium sp. Root482]|jgi:uncharacterized protein YjiS (DUF1127 family)|uniref:DUF1127 domain-containing protein n=1 Tax=Rhizobium sp. Root482 TaxID=1736543 RepID=UPI000701F943|nr:DUF1127 domain-containing protein [Rhizobium sp. Root482]KQY20004.1 hypothetical protein ASD31_06395 [Rhizobium sp. Root482]